MGRVVQLYQQMTYPGQRIQADVKVVPRRPARNGQKSLDRGTGMGYLIYKPGGPAGPPRTEEEAP